MNKSVPGGRLLLAVLKKDLRVYSRNMIYLFMTVLGLAVFVAVFWLVPDKVDEEITFAITPPLSTLFSEGRQALQDYGMPEELIGQLDLVEAEFGEEGLLLVEFENDGQLIKAVSRELEVYKTDQGQFIIHDPDSGEKKPASARKLNLDIGIAFPSTFFSDAVLGQKPKVTVFADAAVPEEIRGAMEGFVREMAYQLAGYDLPVELHDQEMIILGTDRMGEQISMRSRMRPLIAFFMLMMETFAIASLISNEVLQRTVTAILVTPLRVGHFLLAKTIFGTVLTMSQAAIVLALVGAFTVENWPLLLLVTFLGALLFTAVAMFVGSAGKDFIGQLMYSMLFIIPLMIPSFAVLFPGSVAAWVRFLPSYPIVRMLYDITVYDALWAESASYMLYAAAWVVVLYLIGLFVLKRKVATL